MQGAALNRKKSKFHDIFRQLRRNVPAMIGLVIICLLVLMALFADVIVDYDVDVTGMNPSEQFQPPSAEHWFGTDNYGRDLFARVVYGSRISLQLGVITTAACLVIGGLLGAIAGYYGGLVDSIIMRILDTLMAIPAVLLSLAIVASLGPGLRNLMIAITISRIPGFARVIRSSILTVVGQEYIEAAKSCGTSEARIILRHILPNALGPIIVQSTMTIAQNILAAAGLSFIGMGIAPPMPEWGSMLSEAREYMRYVPHMAIFPGLALALSALSFNLLGDGLRDAFDPKMKR